MITIVVMIGLLGRIADPGAMQATKPESNPPAIRLQAKVYKLTKPIEIAHSGTVLEGHGATLEGSGVGIQIGALSNVTIKDVKLVGFSTGISAQGTSSLTLSGVTVTGANTGIGIRLGKVSGSQIQTATIHGCGSGVLLTGCSKVTIEKNDFTRNELCALSLDATSTCLIRDNNFSYTGEKADADGRAIQGVLIANGSDHNQIMRNQVVRCKTVGILLGQEPGAPCTDNTLEANDVSWTDGNGIVIQGQPSNKLIDDTEAHCQVGLLLQRATDTLVQGNLVVGNSRCGIEDELGSKTNYTGNAFAMDTGSPVAMYFKSSLDHSADIRLYQNIFIDYAKPLTIENTSPMTLNSNNFIGTPSLDIEDLAQVTGPNPLVLTSSNDRLRSATFLPSAGPLAALPTIYDHLGGVSISGLLNPAGEAVVEGSLTGAFQGEEEVLARYKGTFPVEITFPQRTVTAVRVKGVSQSRSAYLILLGEQSLAKNKPAEDDADTIAVPNSAVDGDTRSLDHGWSPKNGKAGEWWGVDLHDPVTLTMLTIRPKSKDPNGFWSKFRILISTTGEFHGEETTVVTETDWSQRPGPIRTYRIAPTVGRYIRIVGDVDQSNVLLDQFCAYGINH